MPTRAVHELGGELESPILLVGELLLLGVLGKNIFETLAERMSWLEGSRSNSSGE